MLVYGQGIRCFFLFALSVVLDGSSRYLASVCLYRYVFDPFFTTKSAGQGTGLGLAVCYGIITAHHGRIEVSVNDLGGTTFTITLPT